MKMTLITLIKYINTGLLMELLYPSKLLWGLHMCAGENQGSGRDLPFPSTGEDFQWTQEVTAFTATAGAGGSSNPPPIPII